MMMNEFGPRRGYDGYESPDWWIRDGRRAGGDWMRETPWMQSPWQSSPWQSPWQAPWLRESAWLRDGQQWGRPEGWGWNQSWGRPESWVRSEYEPLVKVVEVFAESPHSWEDATRRAIAEASQSVRGIRSVYIKDMQAVVDEDRVIAFRINAKISYGLDDSSRRRR